MTCKMTKFLLIIGSFWNVNQLKSATNRQHNHLLLWQMTRALTSSDWLRSPQLHYLCSVIGAWRDPTSCWEISERTAQRVLRKKVEMLESTVPLTQTHFDCLLSFLILHSFQAIIRGLGSVCQISKEIAPLWFFLMHCC